MDVVGIDYLYLLERKERGMLELLKMGDIVRAERELLLAT